jgi:hypothetical protein
METSGRFEVLNERATPLFLWASLHSTEGCFAEKQDLLQRRLEKCFLGGDGYNIFFDALEVKTFAVPAFRIIVQSQCTYPLDKFRRTSVLSFCECTGQPSMTQRQPLLIRKALELWDEEWYVELGGAGQVAKW